MITIMYAEGAGSVDHVLVDCVDLQRRPLWHHVLACPAATHLLDPSSHRLYPKVSLCTIPTKLVEAFKPMCLKVEACNGCHIVNVMMCEQSSVMSGMQSLWDISTGLDTRKDVRIASCGFTPYNHSTLQANWQMWLHLETAKSVVKIAKLRPLEFARHILISISATVRRAG